MNTRSTTTTTTVSQGGGESAAAGGRSRSSPWKVYPSWQYETLVQRFGREKVKLIYMVRHAEGTHNVNRDYKNIEQLDARLTKIGIEQCQKLHNELLLLRDDKAIVKKRKYNNIDNSNVDNHQDKRIIYNNHRQRLEYLMRNDVGSDGGNSDIDDNDDICVVVSPLTRCIQTALLSFDFLVSKAAPSKNDFDDSLNNTNNETTTTAVPFVGLESLRETVNYNADRRRRISEISNEFLQVDFSFCQNDEDEIWMSYRRREQQQSELESSSYSSPKDKDKSSETDTIITPRNHLESAELHAVAKRGRQSLEFIESLSQSKLIICTHSAYLRCILNWGQTGGVPKMFDQWLDDQEEHYMRQEKLFDYCYHDSHDCDDSNDSDGSDNAKLGQVSFEEYMRKDYDNAELRSFCLLIQ